MSSCAFLLVISCLYLSSPSIQQGIEVSWSSISTSYDHSQRTHERSVRGKYNGMTYCAFKWQGYSPKFPNPPCDPTGGLTQMNSGYEYLQRPQSSTSEFRQVLHNVSAIFHDMPVNAIKCGLDENGNMLYVGSGTDGLSKRTSSIVHDGSYAITVSGNPQVCHLVPEGFYAIILQINEYPNEADIRAYTDRGLCPPVERMPNSLCNDSLIDKVTSNCGTCQEHFLNSFKLGNDLYICKHCSGGCHLPKYSKQPVDISKVSMTSTAGFIKGGEEGPLYQLDASYTQYKTICPVFASVYTDNMLQCFLEACSQKASIIIVEEGKCFFRLCRFINA